MRVIADQRCRRLRAKAKAAAKPAPAAPPTRLRKAIDDTLNIDKVRTGDLGGNASTAAFTQALVARINGG